MKRKDNLLTNCFIGQTTNSTLASETPGLIACEPTPGTLIGNLPTEAHGVSGSFYVVNNNTLLIENFNYDGRGPGQ